MGHEADSYVYAGKPSGFLPHRGGVCWPIKSEYKRPKVFDEILEFDTDAPSFAHFVVPLDVRWSENPVP